MAVNDGDDDFVLNIATAAPAKPKPPLKAPAPAAPKADLGPTGKQDDQKSQPPRKTFSAPPTAAANGWSGRSNPTTRPKLASGRPPPKPRQLPPDEDTMRGADDDEDGDVADVVAKMLMRDKELQAELSAAGGSRAAKHDASRLGVVEFGDAEDSEDEKRKQRGAKRQRLGKDGGAANGTSGSGAARRSANASSTSGGTAAAAPAVQHVPGMRRHADTSVPSASVAQVFGTQSSAAARSAQQGGAVGSGAAAQTWVALGVGASLVQQLLALKFVAPTVTQQAALPPMLSGRDVLVRAPTGSGKTLSYLIPLINDLMIQQPKIARSDGTYAVVVAPVRELCIQINDVATSLLRPIWWLVPGMIIGGENRAHEKARLRKGLTVLTASPGRLLDHLQNTTCFKADHLRWLVLDEADRLLDLGFQAKLQSICDLLDQRSAGGSSTTTAHHAPSAHDPATAGGGVARRRRQTVLLSATLHAQLSSLAAVSLHDPVPVGFSLSKEASGALSVGLEAAPRAAGTTSDSGPASVSIADEEEEFSIPAQLRQSYLQVGAKDRLMTLAALLRQRLVRTRKGAGAKIVVFVSSCDSVEFHAQLLGQVWTDACGGALFPSGAPLLKLHGDMPQAQRTSTFCKFAEGESGVLVCTDVAARGLDFPAVTTIIQYDVPGATAEYVHRVGRTARMGHAGEAILFLLPTERDYIKMLAGHGIDLRALDGGEALLKWLPLLQQDANDKSAVASSFAGGVGAATAWRLQQRLMTAVAGEPPFKQLASDAFRSYVRAYAAHGAEVKKIFHVRQLHLGHAAFSFALRETPTMLGQSGSAVERKRKKAEAAEGAKRKSKKKWNVAAAQAERS